MQRWETCFFGWPWRRDSPVTFVEGVEMGVQPRIREFERLGEEEWRVLVPQDEEWENRFTEGAMQRRESMGLGNTPTKFLEVDLNVLEAEESDDR